MVSRTNLLMPILSLLSMAITTSPVFAARIIGISIELNGQAILVGEARDNGYPGPYTVWRYLKTSPLTPDKGYAVQTEPGRALEAVLRGKLQVKVRYGAAIAVPELKLTRRQEDQQEWYVDPAWVERVGPPGDPAEEERRNAAGAEEARKDWQRWKEQMDDRQAEYERAKAAEHSKIQEEREAYRRSSFITIGGALVSLTALLVAMGALMFAAKRRRLLSWACAIAVAFGGLVLAGSFTEVPPHVDDARLLELRYYAIYGAAIGSGLAAVAWTIGRWRHVAAS